MKISEFKDYIINKYGKKEWKKYENTYGYLIYSATEEEQRKKLQINGKDIQYINNPSEELQFIAVREEGYALEYIDNPSEMIQIEAIKENPYAIQYISNPSEKLQLLAVKRNPLSIIDIKNPTEKVIEEVVKSIDYMYESMYLLKHLENDLKEK